MLAARLYGAKDLRVEEVEKPEISSYQVLVEVAWTGICGSDLGVYALGLGDQVHPLTNHSGPTTLGHEFSGTVVEIGADVQGVQVGERVAVEPLISCGQCAACQSGYYNQCQLVGFVGLQRDGGFAKFVAVDPHMLHRLPDHVSFEEGALVEPAAVSFYAVRESKLKTGDTVIIFGAGPIGLLTLICVKAAGAAKVIVVDISEERLVKAAELGATAVISGSREDLVPALLDLTGGGADVVYECAGVQSTLNSALYTTKLGAEIMVIATYKEPVTVDMNVVMFKALKLTSTLAYRRVFPLIINLIAEGQLDVKRVITEKIALPDIVEQGVEKLMTDKSQAKILVKPV